MSLTLGDYLGMPGRWWRAGQRRLYTAAPKGLFARSLLIVIVPMVVLQSFVTFFFMERHWQLVTFQLSRVLTQEIAALIDVREHLPGPDANSLLRAIARKRMDMDVTILPPGPLPPRLPKPFFGLLDEALSQQIASQIHRPFWLDTVGESSFIEIRIQLPDAIMRVIARRSAAYASNSHVFLLWMLGTASVLIAIATVFLRNQIRPILRLADAAESFGKGRDHEFAPSGAREVRVAGYAFLSMKRRVERAMEQRTTMLSGVSHDLRTILTRFRLSLALIKASPDVEEMRTDVEEMQRMLEAYLAFARGDVQEPVVRVELRQLLETIIADAERHGTRASIELFGDASLEARPDALRRCFDNLVSNALRYGRHIEITIVRDARFVSVHVDDDGPGIAPERREDAFRPFYRLDEARNQDVGNSGLGLAIARDIARGHGGEVVLGESGAGGLRASVRLPV